jgi:hypothetical protein
MRSTTNDLDKASDALIEALSNAKKLLEHQKICIAKYKDSIKAEYDNKSIFYKFFFDMEKEKDPYGFRKSMIPDHVAKLQSMLRSIVLWVAASKISVYLIVISYKIIIYGNSQTQFVT